MKTSPRGQVDEAAQTEVRAEALAERALAGDREAFEALVAKLQGPAWALARRIVRDREVASEMVQEAFLKVHSHRESFRPGQRFEPWFYRILANLCLNAARRGRYQETPCEPAVLGLSSCGLGGAPDVVVQIRRRDAEMAAAFDRMPPKYRAALALKVNAEMSIDQIAGVLGCPEGTVKTLLFRSRELLRAALKRWEGVEK